MLLPYTLNKREETSEEESGRWLFNPQQLARTREDPFAGYLSKCFFGFGSRYSRYSSSSSPAGRSAIGCFHPLTSSRRSLPGLRMRRYTRMNLEVQKSL